MSLVLRNIAPPPGAAALFEALDKCTPNLADKHREALPCCVQRMTHRPERAVLLNRGYKSLGVVGRDFVNYEDNPEAHISVEHLRLLEPCFGSHYFFDDGNPPWASRGCLREYREKIKDLLAPWKDAAQWGKS